MRPAFVFAAALPYLKKCCGLLAIATLTACSSTHPWINQPLPPGLDPVDPRAVSAITDADSEDLSLSVAVTLSGGGARAAAFAYGVLDGLRQTQFDWNARKTSLLKEVDVISGVSGGSIVATYFAAFGPETFPRFEKEFLRQDIQNSLMWQALNPANLHELSSPWFGRSHLLAQRLDTLYRGKTFGDLSREPGHPRLSVLATDLSLGASFEFSWEQFALICSDLSTVPLSFAVASSSAVPLLLSPMTLKNYSQGCPYQAQVEELPEHAADYRARLAQAQARSYLDASRPYIHLIDGGFVDNLGLRRLLDRSLTDGGIRGVTRKLPQGVIRKLVLVTVNSERDPSERIDISDKVPTTAQVFDTLLFGASSRSTLETLGLLKDVAQQWKRELRSAAVDGQDAFAPDAEIHVIAINLRDAPNGQERKQLMQVPTAFSVSNEDVSRLIEAGRQTLQASPEFQTLLRSLSVKAAK